LRQEAAISGSNVDTAADQFTLLKRPVIYDNISGPFTKASRAAFVPALKKPPQDLVLMETIGNLKI